jgi:hypothetical protein
MKHAVWLALLLTTSPLYANEARPPHSGAAVATASARIVSAHRIVVRDDGLSLSAADRENPVVLRHSATTAHGDSFPMVEFF